MNKIRLFLLTMIIGSITHITAIILTIIYVFFLKRFYEMNPLITIGFIPFNIISNTIYLCMLILFYYFGILKQHNFLIGAIFGLAILSIFDMSHDIYTIFIN